LLDNGEIRIALGGNLDLNGAAFHGRWKLVQFLIEHGADVDHAMGDTGETLLHAALCKANRPAYQHVLEPLLSKGAGPNIEAKVAVPTGSFMIDARTKGETSLHRAAAYGTEAMIDLLIAAGANVQAKDANDDTPCLGPTGA
jgi:ankyrin repeat protein